MTSKQMVGLLARSVGARWLLENTPGTPALRKELHECGKSAAQSMLMYARNDSEDRATAQAALAWFNEHEEKS